MSFMKRLLPLGILFISLSAQAAPRCPGLDKLKAAGKLTLPADPKANFPGKEHCAQEVWNYLVFRSPKQAAFNSVSASAQHVEIQQLAALLEDLDKRLADVKAKVAAYKEDVAKFQKKETAPAESLKLLPKLIEEEGEPASLDPKKVGPKTVKGGTHMQEINKAFVELSRHELMKRHKASQTDDFGPAELRALFWANPEAGKPNQARFLGALAAVDWGVGQAVVDSYREAVEILNGVNAEIRSKPDVRTVANLYGKIRHLDITQGRQEQPLKPGEPPKTTDQADKTVTGQQEAFRKAFAEKTASMIFDGIKKRTELPVEHKEHLTVDQAERLRKEFQGDAEIVDKKIVFTVKDKDGKKVRVPGAEADLPAELTPEKGAELGQRVAGHILAGDFTKAKVAAIVGAITGEEPAADPASKPNITGPQPLPKTADQNIAAPKGFGADVAAANCGSPLDIGKSKAGLALAAKEKAIAERAAEDSKTRAGLEKSFSAEEKAADADLEKLKAGIKSNYDTLRANPSLSAAQIAAINERERSDLNAAVTARNARIQKAEAERDAAYAKIGSRKAMEEKLGKEKEEQYQLVRTWYDGEIVKRADALRPAYKPGSAKVKALAAKLTKFGVAGTNEKNPYKPEWIIQEDLDAFFSQKWDKDRAATVKNVRRRLGVAETGALDRSDLADIDDVDRIVESDLVTFYAEKTKKARTERTAVKGDKQPVAKKPDNVQLYVPKKSIDDREDKK